MFEWSRLETFCIPRKRTPFPTVGEIRCAPLLGKNSMEKRKVSFLYSIHSPDGLTRTLDWENKSRIRNLWMKKKNGLHSSTTRTSACKERTNNEILLTGHLRNYESILGIPTHRTEIQTAKSTTSVGVCLTVVYFSPTAYKNKYIRKRKRNQGNETLYKMSAG